MQSGYRTFEFAHKSIHEYLCADHLVKLPVLPKNLEILSFLPNELAIATSISSDPSEYFCELVLNRLSMEKSKSNFFVHFANDFFSTFVNRLLIEKVDFNLSSKVSFALVVLYTLLRKNEMGQLKLFETDLPAQFEQFVEQVFVRNKKFNYTHFYTIHQEYDSGAFEGILELRKTKRAESYNNLGFILPRTLFAKKSFVTGY